MAPRPDNVKPKDFKIVGGSLFEGADVNEYVPWYQGNGKWAY